MNLQWKKTFFASAADVGAEGAQGVDQALHRALAHLRHAVDSVEAVRGGGAERGEKTRGGAGEADEKISGADGETFRLLGDAEGVGGLVGHDSESKFPQRLGHEMRVLAEKRAGERDGRVAERGEQEGAVGEALRAGQSDFAADGAREGFDREQVGQGGGHGCGRNWAR